MGQTLCLIVSQMWRSNTAGVMRFTASQENVRQNSPLALPHLIRTIGFCRISRHQCEAPPSLRVDGAGAVPSCVIQAVAV